jgi:hypothetical protein
LEVLLRCAGGFAHPCVPAARPVSLSRQAEASSAEPGPRCEKSPAPVPPGHSVVADIIVNHRLNKYYTTCYRDAVLHIHQGYHLDLYIICSTLMLQTNWAQPESISNNWCSVSSKIIYCIQQLCSNKLCRHTDFEETRDRTQSPHNTRN